MDVVAALSPSTKGFLVIVALSAVYITFSLVRSVLLFVLRLLRRLLPASRRGRDQRTRSEDAIDARWAALLCAAARSPRPTHP